MVCSNEFNLFILLLSQIVFLFYNYSNEFNFLVRYGGYNQMFTNIFTNFLAIVTPDSETIIEEIAILFGVTIALLLIILILMVIFIFIRGKKA